MKGKKAEQAEDKDESIFPGINCRRDLTHFLHKGCNGFNHLRYLMKLKAITLS